jgi:hypothetical protein
MAGTRSTSDDRLNGYHADVAHGSRPAFAECPHLPLSGAGRHADERAAGQAGVYPAFVASIQDVSLGDAFWSSVAVNFSASCIGLVVVMTGPWDTGFRIPLTCMALCGVLGLAALLPPNTRRIGVGGLLGVLVSALGFVLVLVAVFVGYYVIGGNELS